MVKSGFGKAVSTSEKLLVLPWRDFKGKSQIEAMMADFQEVAKILR